MNHTIGKGTHVPMGKVEGKINGRPADMRLAVLHMKALGYALGRLDEEAPMGSTDAAIEFAGWYIGLHQDMAEGKSCTAPTLFDGWNAWKGSTKGRLI